MERTLAVSKRLLVLRQSQPGIIFLFCIEKRRQTKWALCLLAGTPIAMLTTGSVVEQIDKPNALTCRLLWGNLPARATKMDFGFQGKRLILPPRRMLEYEQERRHYGEGEEPSQGIISGRATGSSRKTRRV